MPTNGLKAICGDNIAAFRGVVRIKVAAHRPFDTQALPQGWGGLSRLGGGFWHHSALRRALSGAKRLSAGVLPFPSDRSKIAWKG